MKRFYPLLILLAVCTTGIALIPTGRKPIKPIPESDPVTTCETYRVDYGFYRQISLDSRGLYQSDTTQREIVAAAWTCNAEGSPTCNFRALIRYKGFFVPSNGTITSAKLYLYAKTNAINGHYGNPTFGTNNTALLQRVTADWKFDSTGWANQPSITTTGQRVLPQSTSTQQNYEIDLTEFVKFWANKPDSNFGMLLRLQTEDYYNSMIFNSSEAPDSLKPRLVVCYTTPPVCEADFLDSVQTPNSPHRYFIAQPSNRYDKKPYQICWNFGDGKDTCIAYDSTMNYTYGVEHTYDSAGTYNACVNIYYDEGCEADTCKTITVGATPPADSCHVQIIDSTYNGNPLSRLFYALPQHSSNKKPVNICWNFGDGQDTCINYDSNYVGGYWVEHNYGAFGAYTVCATVTFEGGCESQVCKTTQITDTTTPPPVCNNLLVIRGNPVDGRYKQVALDSRGDYHADTTQPEIVSAAWTCNAQGSPTCNFRALFKYNVNSIPANAVVKSAKLYLYAKTNALNGYYGDPTYGSNNTSLLQKVITPWTVTGTGWANQPATTTASQKILAQSTGTRQNYVVNVTDFVQHWVNKPDSNYGMLLRLQTEDHYNSMIFNSGQAPDSLQPRLEICYEVPVCQVEIIDSVQTPNGNDHYFTALNSHDPDMRPAEVCWQFGDGRDTCITYDSSYHSTYSIAHTYAFTGSYNACVNVTYASGCFARTCKTVHVTTPQGDSCNADFTVQGQGHYLDWQFTAIPDHSTNKKPVTICWDFGDGQDSCINYDTSMPANYSITHHYASAGYYEMSVRIIYAGGCEAVKSRRFDIYEPPVIVPDSCKTDLTALSPSNNTDWLFTATNEHSGNQKPVRICWDFGDGQDTCINNDTTQLVSYTAAHHYGSGGSYNVCVKMMYADSCVAEKCKTINVTGSNQVIARIYTNPTSGPLVGWVKTHKAARGDAMLYDQQGNLKQVLKPSIHFISGINLVYMQINRVRVPSGNYFVKIRVGDTVKSFKIVVL